jgi:hypothetical protein
MSSKDIHITTSNGHTQPDRQPLSRQQGDQAAWLSGTGENFTVVFTKDSPFSAHTFTVNPGHPSPSGNIRSDAPDGEYKYEVHGPGGTTDPTIIIQR